MNDDLLLEVLLGAIDDFLSIQEKQGIEPFSAFSVDRESLSDAAKAAINRADQFADMVQQDTTIGPISQ